jgi:TRAP-type C4-dicarboxylate transport system permease small subunit
MDIENQDWFRRLAGGIRAWSARLEWIGLVALMGMVMTALIDVIGSKFFDWPLPGSTEITSVVQVVAIASGLAYSKIDGRHIRVGFLTDRLSRRGNAVFDILISILGIGLFVIAGWMTTSYGLTLMHRGTETFLLGISLYPFAFWIGLCCIPMCLVLFTELLSAVGRVAQ